MRRFPVTGIPRNRDPPSRKAPSVQTQPAPPCSGLQLLNALGTSAPSTTTSWDEVVAFPPCSDLAKNLSPSADAVKPCPHPAEQRWLQAEPFHAFGNSEATKHPSNFSPLNSSTPRFLRPATCIRACGLHHLHPFNSKALPFCSSLWVQEKHVYKELSSLLTHLTLKIEEPWHKPSRGWPRASAQLQHRPSSSSPPAAAWSDACGPANNAGFPPVNTGTANPTRTFPFFSSSHQTSS